MATISSKQFLGGKPAVLTSQPTDTSTSLTTPNFGQRVVTDVKNAGSTVSDAISGEGQFAGQGTENRGTAAASTLLSAPLKVASEALPKPVRQGLDFVGTSFGTGIQKLGELFGSIPALQDFVTKYPDASKFIEDNLGTASNVGNIANNLLVAEGGAKGGKAVSDVSTKVADTANKFVDTTAKGVKDVVTGTSRAGSIAGESILGTQGQEAAIQAYKSANQVSDFINKKATLETVANQARKGVSKIENASMKQLQKVKDTAPNITIPRTTYISTFKNKILDFMGIDGKTVAKVTDKNLGEYLKQTGFGEQEASVIKRLSSKVANWQDTSLKGLLDLKASIAKTGFYKGLPDHVNSDKFVQMVNNHIKELIISEEHGGYSKLGPALQKASNTIDFLDKVKANIIGTGGVNIESAATKLNTLMTKLADPLQKEATIKLLDQFKKLTGVDLVNTLNSARAAKVIEAPLAGIKNPLRTGQGLLDRLVGRAAIKLGKTKASPK